MNLAVQTTTPQLRTNSHSLVDMAADHIQAATKITDITDLRYFRLSDLQQVRTNLHLALELLAASSHRKAVMRDENSHPDNKQPICRKNLTR